MKCAIAVENLVKIYPGGIKAVDNVSFEVNEGEIFGFLGPNGAGKTSTIWMLITLSKITSGKAYIADLDVAKYPEKVRQVIGYVAQDTAVDDALTGWENIRLQARFYHLSKEIYESRIREVMELVQLTERGKDLVETYSGGMRKRLDIASGLIHRPKILFLDEPTLGLDAQTRREIWSYIKHLRDEYGITIFLTTHYMEEADQLCDRVAIIDRGIIKAIDSPQSLEKKIGGDVIRLKFSEENLVHNAAALERIKNLYPVKSVVLQEDYWAIITENGDRLIPKIFSLVQESGASIEAIEMKRPTLEDVYLHLTGRGLRDAEARGEDWKVKTHQLRRARWSGR